MTPLLTASFRGIPFFVESSQIDTGRRVDIHSLPNADTPYIGDQGRKVRSYPVSGRVIGDDFIDQIKQLQIAAETKGPGEYIDPWFGSRTVVCDSFKPTIIDRDNRVAGFSFTFVEQKNSEIKILIKQDTGSRVENNVTAALDTARKQFHTAFSIVSKPQYVIDNAIASVNNILFTVSSMNSKVMSIDTFKFQLDRISKNLTEILLDPVLFTEKIIKLFTIQNDNYSYENELDDNINLYKNIDTQDTAIVDDANVRAVNEFMSVVCICKAARASTRITFATLNDAQFYKKELISMCDLIMEDTSDELFSSLFILRGSINEDITSRFVYYPQVTTYTPHTTIATLLLSYQLYGSAEKESDIISRNTIIHPAFLSPANELEVVENV
jgi:prophage DNA circulation protein